jgi:glycosyltransferase involved in cell wall biosynthesis
VVSVIIPAYNAIRWLQETLASVAAQSGVDFEVIIVDDGSTDATATYVAANWPQFQLVRSTNRGVSHARNLGTAEAQGDLIQYLDADDLLFPGKLQRQVALFETHPEVDVIYSNWQRLNESADGQFVLGEVVCRAIEDIHPDPEIAFFATLWCPTGGYLYRRAFLDQVLPWKEWLPVVQDARFAWDAAAAGARWLHDPTPSVLYRQHRSGSVSTQNRLAFLLDCLANVEDIRRHWEAKHPLTPDQRQAILSGYESAMRGLFAIDLNAFHRAYQQLLAFDPGYQPSHPGLRRLSKFLGYENAERIAQAWRQLKSVVRG